VFRIVIKYSNFCVYLSGIIGFLMLEGIMIEPATEGIKE